MVKRLLRNSTIAMTAVMSLGMSGAASASSIGTSGPGSSNRLDSSSYRMTSSRTTNDVGVQNSNQQTARTGSVSSNGNTSSGGGYGDGSWQSCDPAAWQQNGRGSFGDWYGQAMGMIGGYGAGMNSGSWGNDDNWSPSGDNWQGSWNNWDPQMWMSHGSSWNNWHRQMTEHMAGNFNGWMTGWNGGGGGMSGSASNVNDTNTGVGITNQSGNAWGGNGGYGAGGNGEATIYRTGPDSNNTISDNNRSSYSSTTDNRVGVTNSNDQSARSGDVQTSGNTVAGGGTSGAASNVNSTGTTVTIVNDGSGGGSGFGSGGNGGGYTIAQTGPDSNNRISENNSSSYRESTSNTVNVTNSNRQDAQSGDVTSSHNTVAGGGRSGAASNSNGTGSHVGLYN